MFDQLVEEAKYQGGGDLLLGLMYIGNNPDEFDDELLRSYRAFMNMGYEMFRPVDKEVA